MNCEKITIGQTLRKIAREFPNKIALANPAERLTFAELDNRVDQLAQGFAALGVRRGDQVALWMTNCPTWIVAWFAVVRLGATLVPINTRYKAVEAKYILKQSDSKILVTMDTYWDIDFLGMLVEIMPDLPRLRTVIVWNDNVPIGMLSLREVLAKATEKPAILDALEAQVSPDDPAIIVYTSGTTGFPKGAVHDHVVLRNCANIARVLRIEHDDVLLGHMPFYHVAGAFAAVLPALLKGCTLITVDHWKPADILALIDTERVSIMAGIPTHYIDLIDEVRRSGRSPSTLKTGWIGGATVTPDVATAALHELNMQSLQAVYGMTETTSSTTFSAFDDPFEILCENKGKPIGDFEVAVFGDDGLPVPVGSVGEVWVRGHLVMQGYYKNPSATAEVMTADGWFKTGDLGLFDESGYLKITGRKKEMFIVGGSNTYPAEIERMLQSHKAVRQAVVVGVPDRRLGEVGYAFVECKQNKPGDAVALRRFCRAAMADYKVPRYFEFVDEFPKTTTGKIRRAELATRAASAVASGKQTDDILLGD